MVSSARIPVWTTAFSSWGPSVTPCPGSWMRVSELPWCTTMVKCLGIGGQAEQCSSRGKMNTICLGWCYPYLVHWATFCKGKGGHEAVWCSCVQQGWCCVYFGVESVLPSNRNVLRQILYLLCLYSYDNDCSVSSILYNT